MNNHQLDLPTLGISLEKKVEMAIALLREHEPDEGYYVAFSGGKDSQVIERLCREAGVKHDAHYNNTTIDPPELVRFIKKHYSYVVWNNPEMPMMKMVAEANKVPPTRMVRWCCEVYKEHGGDGRVKIIGVRQAESPRRKNWSAVSQDIQKNKVICPIVFWTDEDVWSFIKGREMPYCDLYDQGRKRLGCVGCMLAGPKSQDEEFAIWPKFEANWKKAIYRNWEKWHDIPRNDGKPRFQSRFKTAEEFWLWWRRERKADVFREDCQSGLLWTNVEEGEE